MKQKMKQLMMMLALLLTAATSAWAESKPIGLNVEYKAGDVITNTSTTAVYVRWGSIIVGGTPRECVIKITGISSKWPTIQYLRCAESEAVVRFNDEIDFEVFYQDNGESTNSITHYIVCVGECSGDLDKVHVASGSGTRADPYVFAPGPAASSGNAFPITWSATSPNTASIEAMPAGNVTVNVKYYPQATAEGAVTAATGVLATTDDPLVTLDKTKLTGAAKMMYYVSTSATAPAYNATGWTDKLPTAKDYTEAANLNVWYYPVGADDDDPTKTYSDGDMNATALPVTLGDAPLWNAEFDLTNAPEEDKAPGVWSTDIPESGVIKGTEVGCKVHFLIFQAKKSLFGRVEQVIDI